MSTEHWEQGVDWNARVAKVIAYYFERPKLKYGPAQEKKAFPLIKSLCTQGKVTRAKLVQDYGLTIDGPRTILSNVTMAIQGTGEVWAPEKGGWYKKLGSGDGYTYIVCPGFAAAWVAKAIA